MNAELRPISYKEIKNHYGELYWLVNDLKEVDTIIEYSRHANPLFIAKLDYTVLGFVGFLPRSTLSDIAYVWVHTTPNAIRHKTAVARLARRWIPIFHTRYPTLLGHCFEDHSRRWLRTLGATFGPDNTFTIKARHG